MSTIFWVIGVHLFELLLIGGYLLIKKNSSLEKGFIKQQQYIDAISIIINNSSETIKQLDSKGAFESDDEVGTFFKNLKEIQNILDDFNLHKK